MKREDKIKAIKEILGGKPAEDVIRKSIVPTLKNEVWIMMGNDLYHGTIDGQNVQLDRQRLEKHFEDRLINAKPFEQWVFTTIEHPGLKEKTKFLSIWD